MQTELQVTPDLEIFKIEICLLLVLIIHHMFTTCIRSCYQDFPPGSRTSMQFFCFFMVCRPSLVKLCLGAACGINFDLTVKKENTNHSCIESRKKPYNFDHKKILIFFINILKQFCKIKVLQYVQKLYTKRNILRLQKNG